MQSYNEQKSQQTQKPSCKIHDKNEIIAIDMNPESKQRFLCQQCIINCINVLSQTSNTNLNKNPQILHIDELKSSQSIDLEGFPFSLGGKELKQNIKKLQVLQENKKEKASQQSNFQGCFDVLDQFQKDVSSLVENFVNQVKSYLQSFDFDKLLQESKDLFQKTYSLDILKTSLQFPPAIPSTLQTLKVMEQKNNSEINDINNLCRKLLDFTDLQNKVQLLSNSFTKQIKNMQSSFETLEQVPLVKSKVGLPDAYNLVLYTQDLKVKRTLKLSFEQMIDQKKCHFFVGIVRDELKDQLGYNHDMPAFCLCCENRVNEVIIEQIMLEDGKKTALKITNQDEVLYEGQIDNKQENDQLYRFFMNFSHDDLKFKLYEL